MVNINRYLSDKQRSRLEQIGLKLYDNHNYSDDELMEMHDKITDYYLQNGFDELGEPNNIAYECESIIDLFYDEFKI